MHLTDFEVVYKIIKLLLKSKKSRLQIVMKSILERYFTVVFLGHYLFLEAHSFPRASLFAYFRAEWRLLSIYLLGITKLQTTTVH